MEPFMKQHALKQVGTSRARICRTCAKFAHRSVHAWVGHDAHDRRSWPMLRCAMLQNDTLALERFPLCGQHITSGRGRENESRNRVAPGVAQSRATDVAR